MARLFRVMSEEILAWFCALLSSIPGRSGQRLRSAYYRTVLRRSGSALAIGERVELACPQNISVGDEIYIVSGAVIRACGDASISIGDHFALNGNARIIADSGGRIIIGNGVLIGPNVVVRASNHGHARYDIPVWRQGQTGGEISIGNDVWIGANVVILPDVKIGSHVIVAAGSVVTKDLPDFAIAGGVPARVLKLRTDT